MPTSPSRSSFRLGFAFSLVFCLGVSLTGGAVAWAQSSMPQGSEPLWSGAYYNDAVYSTGAHLLHNIGITGQGLTTAIVDGGFYTNHEIFAGKNIVNLDDYAGGMEDHGTHVAGIAMSMAPDAGLWIGTYGRGDDKSAHAVFSDIMADAAKYNIVSVNNSWGDPIEGQYPNAGLVAQKNPLTAAIVKEMLASGIVVVAASGNGGDNDRMSFMDGLSGVLSVGAMNQYGYITEFSTQYRKDGWFLLAPGNDIYSAWEVDPATGESVYRASPGTSMASPHVSGAITLLKSGARNASSEEIVSALYDSAIRVPYDGDAVFSKQYVSITSFERLRNDLVSLKGSTHDTDLDHYIDWLNDRVLKHSADALTADDWRIIRHMQDVLGRMSVLSDHQAIVTAFVEIMKTTGDLSPLRYTDYRFLQVDAAYRLLTKRRSNAMAANAALAGSSHSSAMMAFANEMGLALDKDTADLFQRLDGQPGDVLARAARQLGPGFVDSTLQSSIFGMLGLHGSVENRFDLFANRDHLADFSHGGAVAAAETDLGDCTSSGDPRKRWTLWAEGFGAYQRRGETTNGGDYHGSFAGVMTGIEYAGGDAVFGGFAAWTNHNIKGDGRSRGNWGTLGLYAGVSRDAFSAGLSVAAGLGDYAVSRNIDGPGASFMGMDYAPVAFRAGGDSRAFSLSARAGAGWRLIDANGWSAGPAIEASFAHSRMKGYDEDRGGAFRLSIDSHDVNYLEGGAGVRVSKSFVKGCRPFVVSARVMGLYGRNFANDMTGRFSAGGSAYRVSPEENKGFWCVPEASLTWKATERVTVSAAYQGRFGRHTAVNAASLSLGVAW